MRVIMTLVISLMAIAIMQTHSSAEDRSASTPGYAGNIEGGNGAYLIHAEQIKSICMNAYRKRFGHDPKSWQEICSMGYCQIDNITNPDGSPVNFDDGKLDGPWDIYYTYDPLTKRGTAHTWVPFGNRDEMREHTTPGKIRTFADQLQTQRDAMAYGNFHDWSDVGNLDRFYERNAVYEIANRSIMYFRDIHHRNPTSLAELFGSGLCPFGPDAVNPVSGKEFSSAKTETLEFVYNDNGSYAMYYLDENGKRISMLSMPVSD